MTDTKASELAEVIARVRRMVALPEAIGIPCPSQSVTITFDTAITLCDAASRVAQLEVELAEAKADAERGVLTEPCDCYDGVILGPRYDVDPDDISTCPKCACRACSGSGACKSCGGAGHKELVQS